MKRPRRTEVYFEGTCNGDDLVGCPWRTPMITDGADVKAATRDHAREAQHEAVVTEHNRMVVFDGRAS